MMGNKSWSYCDKRYEPPWVAESRLLIFSPQMSFFLLTYGSNVTIYARLTQINAFYLWQSESCTCESSIGLKRGFKWAFMLLGIYTRPTLWMFTTLCECNQDYSTDPSPQSCFRWNCIPTKTPRKEIIFPFHFINSQNESLSHPRKLSGMTFPLSLWLVVCCICLLTSWFIYWCLAWNHGWHGIPWCKWKQVNIPVSLPAAAALETWISAVNVTPASCWWERTNTLYTEY